MKNKKIIAAVLSLVMLTVFTACNNQNDTTDAVTDPVVTSEASSGDPEETTLIPQETTLIPQETTLIPPESGNGDNTASGEYTYVDLEDGSVEILSYTGPGGVVSVPSQIDGKQVSKIDYLVFYENLEITELTIPDGITEIEPFNFHSMYNMTKLTIGNGATQLPDSAISTNTGLVTLVLPDTLEILDDYAILGNESLTELYIGDSITSIGIGNLHQSDDVTVYGPEGSPMQAYCAEKGLTYVVE